MTRLKVYVVWTLVVGALWMWVGAEAQGKSQRLDKGARKLPRACNASWATPGFRRKWETLRNSTEELRKAVKGSRAYEKEDDKMWKACKKDLFKKIPSKKFQCELPKRLSSFRDALELVRDAYQIEAAKVNLTIETLTDLLLDPKMPKNITGTPGRRCRKKLTDAKNEDREKVILETLLDGLHDTILGRLRRGKQQRRAARSLS